MSVPVRRRCAGTVAGSSGWGCSAWWCCVASGRRCSCAASSAISNSRVPSELAEDGLRGRVGGVLGAGRGAAVCRTAWPSRRTRSTPPSTSGVSGRSSSTARAASAVHRWRPTTGRAIRLDDRRPDHSVDDTVTASSTSPASTIAGEEDPATPDFDSILEVVTSGPQFSILSSLIDGVRLDGAARRGGSVHAVRADRRRVRRASRPTRSPSSADDPDRARRPVATPRRRRRAPVQRARARCAGDARRDHADVAVDDDGDITIGGASVTTPDLVAANGVVHAIDGFCCRATPAEPDDRVADRVGDVDRRAGRAGREVADESQRAVLVDAASRFLDPANVDDRLTVSAGRGDRRRRRSRALAELVAAMPPYLVSGESGFDGTDVYAERCVRRRRRAHARSSRSRTSWRPRSSSTPRPTASDDDAGSARGRAQPGSSSPTRSSSPRRAPTCRPTRSRCSTRSPASPSSSSGVTITIEGHTDSDGVPAENQALSEQRALDGALRPRRARRSRCRPGVRRPRLDAARSSSAVSRTRMRAAGSSSG